ncbi:MAG TPA: heme ABC exporter ATP-binding protein CcmA [Gemmataceae bacterium]|nr:heme ABC exporter ATP-binding protein CcmA [Gemmataceae bacterium]
MADALSGGNLPDLIRVDRPVIIGRATNAAVRLPHPAVSRRHAELRPDHDGISVRDLRSRTGVLVNGVAVTGARLHEADVVAFGPVAYEVKGQLLLRRPHVDGVKVEARNLTIQRGGSIVLQGVNLTIPANNFVGILGPSGAGKTTLLKALTGYMPSLNGQVFLDGIDVSVQREVCRAMVGFVPQEDVVYPTLTARENLAFALRLRVAGDLRREEQAAWIEQALARLHLQAVADRPVRTLSGGERKRVNVAVELLSRPRLLLLDEPTAGLDPAAEARLMQFLRDLARRGTTILCTTHVLESLNLFDAVMVVAGGRLLGSGSPQNLLSHFQSQTYAELYEKLDQQQPPSPSGALPTPALHAAAAPPRHRRAGTLSQIATQVQRGLLLIARDRVWLALLISQPLLIGLLITLSQFNPGGTKGLDLLYTFAVVAAIWLGLNNTAREVVRDRAVYIRERRTVVNPESYLLAKGVLFACIGLAQVVLLVLWLRFANFFPADYPEAADLRKQALLLLLILWLTYLSAMFLGLLISTLAPTEEAAVAMLPLVVLPQLLLTGVASNRVWDDGGYFHSLPVLIVDAGETDRGAAGWALEGASMMTYSRPALVFFLHYPENVRKGPLSGLNPTWVAVVNWAHLLFMLLATATAFVAFFLRRERRWLEAS